jgi:hypothetical protein
MTFHPPRHLVWSTDTINLRDPFQKRWLLRQTLVYGRAEDICNLDLEEMARDLEKLNLPNHVYSLWHRYLEYKRK